MGNDDPEYGIISTATSSNPHAATAAMLGALAHEVRSPLNVLTNVPRLLLEHMSETVSCRECGTVIGAMATGAEATAICRDCHVRRVGRAPADNLPSPQRMLALLDQAAQRLNDAAELLLDFMLLQSNGLRLTMARVPVAMIVEDVRDAMMRAAGGKDIRVDCAIEMPQGNSGAWNATMQADVHRLTRVLRFLGRLVVKHTAVPGVLRVECNRHIDSFGKGQVVLTIGSSGARHMPASEKGLLEDVEHDDLMIIRKLIMLQGGEVLTGAAVSGAFNKVQIVFKEEAER